MTMQSEDWEDILFSFRTLSSSSPDFFVSFDKNSIDHDWVPIKIRFSNTRDGLN